jgi:hypothetical protein
MLCLLPNLFPKPVHFIVPAPLCLPVPNCISQNDAAFKNCPLMMLQIFTEFFIHLLDKIVFQIYQHQVMVQSRTL